MAWLVRFLTENWGLKLAALSLAVLLWLAVTANEPERASFRNTAVNVDLRDPDWRLVRVEPAAVTVTVQGPRGELVDLGSDPPRIVLPVENVSDSVAAQVLPLQWVQLPAGIREARVLGLRPDTVRLHYERLAVRTLPVSVRTSGGVAEGYTLSRPVNTNPATLEAHGPASTLEAIDSIPLFPVDLSGLTATTNVPTGVDTTRFEDVRFSPDEVNVILRVVPTDSQPPVRPESARRSPR